MPSATPFDPLTWREMIDPRRSLAAAAGLILGGATLGLVVSLAYVTGFLLQRQLEARGGTSFETLASQVGDKLDRAVYERYRQLQFTATLPAVRNPAMTAAERLAALESLHDSSPDFAWTGFADANGIVQVATQHLFEKEDVTNAPWYRNARRRPFVGTLHELPALAATFPPAGAGPRRFIDLAVPVNSASGQFLGVLGAQLHWSWAREVQLSVVPETARREQLGVTLYSAAGDVMLDSGGSGWTEPPEIPADISDRPGTRGTLIEKTGGGTVYLTSYVRASGHREYRGLGWLVVVRQPADRAFAAVGYLRTRIMSYGLIFAFALALLGWIVAARLERRFRAIALAAHRIGDGDVLTLMPRPKGDSDFARMCAALDAMVEKFRGRDGR